MTPAKTGIPAIDAVLTQADIADAWKRGTFQDLMGDGIWRVCKVIRLVDDSNVESIDKQGELGEELIGCCEVQPVKANIFRDMNPLFAQPAFPGLKTPLSLGDLVIVMQPRQIDGFGLWLGPIRTTRQSPQNIPLDSNPEDVVLRSGAGGLIIGNSLDIAEGSIDGQTAAELNEEVEEGDASHAEQWSFFELAAGRSATRLPNGTIRLDLDLTEAMIRGQERGWVDRLLLDGNTGDQAVGEINQMLRKDEVVDLAQRGAILIGAGDAVRIFTKHVDNDGDGDSSSIMLMVVDVSKEFPRIVSKISITGDGNVDIVGQDSATIGVAGPGGYHQALFEQKQITIGGKPHFKQDHEKPSNSPAADKLEVKSELTQGEQLNVLMRQVAILSDQVKVLSANIELGTKDDKGSFVRAEKLEAYLGKLVAWASGIGHAPVLVGTASGFVKYGVDAPSLPDGLKNEQVKA